MKLKNQYQKNKGWKIVPPYTNFQIILIVGLTIVLFLYLKK